MARRKRVPKRPSGDYEVGYGKPPKETRWQKGFCPNPKGRGKKQDKKNTVAEILDRLLVANVTVRDGAGTQQLTRIEYLVMKAIEKAGKGDLHALKFIIEMRQRFPSVTPEMGEPKEIDADDLAIIADYMTRLKDEGAGEP